MGIFDNKKEELENLRAENNRLRFEVEDLKRTIASLKVRIEEQEPFINSLQKRINEQQDYITKFNIDVINDEQKWEEYQKVGKPSKKKTREVEK